MPCLPAQTYTPGEVTGWISEVVLRTCRTTVAVRRREVVGYAALDGDVLEHLYVRADVLRQGIGTLLLDEIKTLSSERVSLRVFAQNTEARAFYERHGFAVVRASDGSDNMERLPDLTLHWIPVRENRSGKPLLPENGA
ncbi:GNAT family N-acetyltransferase [Amycolatopsis alkalitolerans]|uniref:GNAT family N-acetyltransferase n=2 Tax=Amycolatopsis alkalitolerans TaxID=2547244 RepID=A0A5C4M2E3_9PSEU|nr:GNAT family N-acetyltransferase [Amycolatopsis alkalitolerans]